MSYKIWQFPPETPTALAGLSCQRGVTPLDSPLPTRHACRQWGLRPPIGTTSRRSCPPGVAAQCPHRCAGHFCRIIRRIERHVRCRAEKVHPQTNRKGFRVHSGLQSMLVRRLSHLDKRSSTRRAPSILPSLLTKGTSLRTV